MLVALLGPRECLAGDAVIVDAMDTEVSAEVRVAKARLSLTCGIDVPATEIGGGGARCSPRRSGIDRLHPGRRCHFRPDTSDPLGGG